MNDYTLVVIDMQDYFWKEDTNFPYQNGPRVLNEVEKLILKAKKDNCAIIYLEYIGVGDTIDRLVEASKDHSKVFFLEKSKNSGAQEVISCIKDNKLSKNILICGVNTDYCVYETVRDLVYNNKLHNFDITVIEQACGSNMSHLSGLRSISQLPVKIKSDMSFFVENLNSKAEACNHYRHYGISIHAFNDFITIKDCAD